MKKYLSILVCFFAAHLYAQQIADEVEAVVGDEIILTSEIETQYYQYLSQGFTQGGEIRCKIMEDLLYQKLLINQAKLDSLEISDQELENELDKRIRYFIHQIGSQEKLEAFYGKTVVEIKSEFKEIVKDQLLSQKIQSGITTEVKVTPSEVRNFYNQFSKDSLPIIEAEVEIAQILIKPIISKEEQQSIIDKLNTFKNRIEHGEDFKMIATLYSDDAVSAKNGGELGFMGRGELVPEFEAAAFKLKENEISPVIKTEFGHHIIQLIERRGEQINVRHILLKPKVSSLQLMETKSKIEDIANQINNGMISFEDAVIKYSDDESKNNEGLLINPNSGTSMFVLKDLEPSLYFVIEKMEENEISAPFVMQTTDGSKAYQIVKLRKKKPTHYANLKDDYDKIQNVALSAKKQEKIDDWMKDKIQRTYISILGLQWNECNFKYNWTPVK